MRAYCPAKINLHLEIGARRADGFHELATLFQAVGFCDVLEAERDDAVRLICEGATLSCGEDNLVVRAARALQERFGAGGCGARLVLRKSIPVGGGLGGSSNAAGALVLLSRLWELDPDPSDLAELAGGLGSDVAFFLRGGTAVGTGRGRRLPRPPRWESGRSCSGSPVSHLDRGGLPAPGGAPRAGGGGVDTPGVRC